jgi:arsenate reductase-like glutaredoxin family protein
VGETVVANKVKLGAAEALALARKAKAVVATRGQQVVRIDLRRDTPTDDDLLAVLLGPTGNLRAPAAVVGDLLVVGFSPELYGEVLNGDG